MLKRLIFLPLFLCLLFSSVSFAKASLVTITSGGEVVVNVLSIEDSIELEIPQNEYLAVKEITSESASENVSVSLSRDGDKISLNISGESGEKSLDVTNYSDELIEIEERPRAQKLSVSVSGNQFVIRQGSLFATTDYEMNINPKNASLTLATPSGLKYLSLFPREAVNVMFRSKIIDRIEVGKAMVLKEEVGQDLAYEVEGIKTFNIFNVYNYELPVKAKVSATTGQIAQIVEPPWMKYLGFLFL